ncbi:alpha/beta fold hydrolase [Halalkalibacter krulwichiae]|uniref:Alpha/beta hydrolase family protein n=1 Tax=Halalkalibacter krulwichiae TaxID=199441 RepID=A0A1X9MAX4_9BACI|nr:alpha/beta hydrolase [Halalkalibacter krulwichiae]ARK30595.1 hypothetical protein BkAM31D_12565 [Halalkalibacter krulwichiae]
MIGLQLIHLYPEKYHSYIGVSQIINWVENDRLALTWAKGQAKKRNHKKALEELTEVGQPPFVESFEQWGILRKWQARFNSMIYSDAKKGVKHPGYLSVIKVLISSKDYSLKDIYNSFYKGFKLIYTIDFINELPNIDFLTMVKKVEVPITFIHGKHDFHVSSKLVETFYNEIDARMGKRFLWMDKSAHIFHPDDTKKIESVLIEELKYVK